LRNPGYDITSLDLNSGELCLIEIKGLSGATGTILLSPNERRVAEDRRDCYWLYVVTRCGTAAQLQEPIKDPDRFPWHEAYLPRQRLSRRRQVTKVQHYWLGVDAMTQPMEVREDPRPYGKGGR
jgi:hypothetical protein